MALSTRELKDQFRNRAPLRGASKELYLPIEHADDFLAACDANGIAVQRIEGFEFDGTSIMPRLDLISEFHERDLPWRDVQRAANEFASKILREFEELGANVLTFALESEAEPLGSGFTIDIPHKENQHGKA